MRFVIYFDWEISKYDLEIQLFFKTIFLPAACRSRFYVTLRIVERCTSQMGKDINKAISYSFFPSWKTKSHRLYDVYVHVWFLL